ncbi:amidohydrolase family protein [Pseudonocardia broussonetiae]|uniref:amidohydrolase family protein n=1 Tax=Pseudonocardia broussonetiae TaxID=2736640 RepID=UPI00196666D0|nr:amidohydrolase family protein [Pseudonocardia broussonetiae]
MRTHGLIDCDVHNAVPSDAALLPYLPARWRRHLELVGSRTYSPFAKGYAYPKAARFASRHDAWPPSGGPPGSDLEFMRAQLLDAYGVDVAVLNCLYRASEQRYDAYGAALAAAVHDWQVEHWLERDPRLRASITVPFESPDLAAAEIDRAAAHPASCRCCCSRGPGSRWARGTTGRSTRRPRGPGCRWESMQRPPPRGRSPPVARRGPRSAAPALALPAAPDPHHHPADGGA